MRKIVSFLLCASMISVPCASAAEGYLNGLKDAYVRGFKNIFGAPIEIPYTIQQYHEERGRPGIRQTAGFIDGSFRMIRRLGAGAWDLTGGLIPGYQEGIPMEPETFF